MDLDLVQSKVQDIIFWKLSVISIHDSIIITYRPNFKQHHD
jgi:hypothetical protein